MLGFSPEKIALRVVLSDLVGSDLAWQQHRSLSHDRDWDSAKTCSIPLLGFGR